MQEQGRASSRVAPRARACESLEAQAGFACRQRDAFFFGHCWTREHRRVGRLPRVCVRGSAVGLCGCEMAPGLVDTVRLQQGCVRCGQLHREQNGMKVLSNARRKWPSTLTYMVSMAMFHSRCFLDGTGVWWFVFVWVHGPRGYGMAWYGRGL